MVRRLVALILLTGIVLMTVGCNSGDTTTSDLTDKAKAVQQTQQASQAKDGVKSE